MAQQWWKPAWTVPAAMRAARATLVVPALFAITDKVVADPQMALFATFGGFATLVIAGVRRHQAGQAGRRTSGLAVAGSLALIIGTLVSGTPWLAAVVTVPVTFAIFFAGIGRPERRVRRPPPPCSPTCCRSPRPAAPPPSRSRLEGWWLASAAGTIAVLLLSPRAPGSRLREAAADLAGELADRVRARRGRRGDQAGGDAGRQATPAGRVHRRAVPPDRARHPRPGAVQPRAAAGVGLDAGRRRVRRARRPHPGLPRRPGPAAGGGRAVRRHAARCSPAGTPARTSTGSRRPARPVRGASAGADRRAG